MSKFDLWALWGVRYGGYTGKEACCDEFMACV